MSAFEALSGPASDRVEESLFFVKYFCFHTGNQCASSATGFAITPSGNPPGLPGGQSVAYDISIKQYIKSYANASFAMVLLSPSRAAGIKTAPGSLSRGLLQGAFSSLYIVFFVVVTRSVTKSVTWLLPAKTKSRKPA